MLALVRARDPEPHHIAGLEVARRLLAHADAGRRAGGDDVAGHQRHEVADVADQMVDREDHRPGVAVLHPLAIDVEPHVERLRIGDLVARHQPRPERGEAVAALALVPGAAALELIVALRHVVADEVAGDVGERVMHRDVAGGAADDHGELDLPIGLFRAARDAMTSSGPAIEVVALAKTIGSVGGWPVSAAWSE